MYITEYSYYIMYNSVRCEFVWGFFDGDSQFVGKTKTEDDCLTLVKKKIPHAIGVTYSLKDMCWAKFGNLRKSNAQYYRSCYFRGTLNESH